LFLNKKYVLRVRSNHQCKLLLQKKLNSRHGHESLKTFTEPGWYAWFVYKVSALCFSVFFVVPFKTKSLAWEKHVIMTDWEWEPLCLLFGEFWTEKLFFSK
jgi:hypothetical protein